MEKMQEVKRELEDEIRKKEQRIVLLKNEITKTRKEMAKLRNIIKKVGGLNE